jgi:hypothetical protein
MSTRLNIVIDQGTDWEETFTLLDDAGDPIDASALALAGQLRPWAGSNTSYSLTMAGANTGVVTMSLTRVLSANVPAGRYEYDVVGVSASNVASRLVNGVATVTAGVTR